MITNEIYFFKNQSSVSTSDYLYNVNDGTLILQVDGDVSNLELSVLGNTDLVDDDFVTLKTINASDYNMSDKITSTGIYWIDINGIRKIKLNLSKITGSVSVKAITKRGLTTDLVARAMAANAAAGGSYTLPVASASTLGGIKVGENLTIDEDGTLSASGGTNNNIPSFFIDIPSQPLDENNTGIKYTLPTSFNEKLTTNLNNILDIYQTFSIQFLINNILVTFNPSYSTDTYGYGTRRFNSTSKPTSINLFANIVNNRYDISTSADPVMYGGFLPVTLELTLTWNNTTPSVTKGVYKLYGYSSPIPSIQYIQKNLLTKTNNTSYTPTKDYNPATKKYVDDGLKSINNGIPTIMTTSSFDTNITDEATLNELSNLFTEYYNNHNQSFNGLCFNLITTVDRITGSRLANFYSLGNMNSSAGPYFITTSWSKNSSAIQYADISYSTVVVPVNISNNIVTVSAFNPSLTYSNELLSNRTLTKNNTKSFTPTANYHPATKKYVDDAVASASGGEPEMYILEFSGNYNSSRQYNATDNDKIRIAELITTLKEDANVPIYVKFKNGYGLLFTPLYDIKPGQQPYYLYQCLKYNNSNLRVLYFCGLNIYGTWENDIFTVSTCTVSTDTNGFLSTGTQSLINDGFNPTLDQHPATKKYVDDTIASAITTSLEGSY